MQQIKIADYMRAEVNSIDELIAHSLGIVVSVHCEVSARRLNDRRRVPGQRSHGPLVLEAGKNIPGITPLSVLQISRGTISRGACGVISL